MFVRMKWEKVVLAVDDKVEQLLARHGRHTAEQFLQFDSDDIDRMLKFDVARRTQHGTTAS